MTEPQHWTDKERWLNFVIRAPNLSLASGAVATYLFLHVFEKDFIATGKMETWPSQITIADALGISRRSVQYALRQLRKEGYLRLLVNGKNKTFSSRYELRIRLKDATSPVTDANDDSTGANNAPVSGSTGANGSTDRRKTRQTTGAKHDKLLAQNLRIKHKGGAALRAGGATDAPRLSDNSNGNTTSPDQALEHLWTLIQADKKIASRANLCAEKVFNRNRFEPVYDSIKATVGKHGVLLATLLLNTVDLDRAKSVAATAARRNDRQQATLLIVQKIGTAVCEQRHLSLSDEDICKQLKADLRGALNG